MALGERTALQLAASAARRLALRENHGPPQPGDLVVEVTGFRRQVDPDSIGWLVGHGEATYREDNTGPTREVWDVLPLSGAPGVGGRVYQRWENAQFLRVPPGALAHVDLQPPPELAALIAEAVA